MAKYPYIELPGAEGSILKPLIGIHLGYPKTHKVTTGIYALIDSGADVCFCSADIGAWLGIALKKSNAQSFTAANSAHFTATKEVITLYAGNKQYLAPFYFTADLPKQTPIILGQIGFFDHFKITFDHASHEIEII